MSDDVSLRQFIPHSSICVHLRSSAVQISSDASQGQDQAFDLQARAAEVEQQAKVQARGSKVIHALRTVDIIQRFAGLQFHDHCLLDQKVNRVLANNDTVVYHDDPMLLRDSKAGLAKLVRQRIFINLLKESGPERVGYDKRAADNALGETVQYGLICVHLRSSAVKYSWLPPCQPNPAKALTAST
jgi:hypothetical protein